MELLALFLLAFGGAITPGPDILLVMRNALLFGFMQGLKVFSGIASGWVVYLGVLYFGFGYVLQGDIIQIALSVVGACYLLYIAFALARKSATHIDFQKTQQKDTYLKALLINLSNPKAILFFSVIVAPFIQSNLAMSLFVLFCGLSSAFLVVIVLATFFRNLIQDRIFHIIDKVCAFLFVGFALLLLHHAYTILPNPQ